MNKHTDDESVQQKWQITSSRYLLRDKWLTVRADTCETSEGHIVEPYYVLEYADWANCLVIDDNNDVVMVDHYRHGIGEFIPEFVSGGLEADDPSPTDGIRRELEEELGYIGGNIYPLGASYPNPASHTNKVHSFLAVGGSCAQPQRLEPGESLRIMKIPLEQFVRTMTDPDVTYPSIQLAAVFLALHFIRNSSLPNLRLVKEALRV